MTRPTSTFHCRASGGRMLALLGTPVPYRIPPGVPRDQYRVRVTQTSCVAAALITQSTAPCHPRSISSINLPFPPHLNLPPAEYVHVSTLPNPCLCGAVFREKGNLFVDEIGSSSASIDGSMGEVVVAGAAGAAAAAGGAREVGGGILSAGVSARMAGMHVSGGGRGGAAATMEGTRGELAALVGSHTNPGYHDYMSELTPRRRSSEAFG